MGRLLTSRQLAGICRAVIHHTNSSRVPVLACNVFRTSESLQWRRVDLDLSASSKWSSMVQRRCLHSSRSALKASLISPEYILGSPYPDVDIPTNVTAHDLILQSCDENKDSVALEEFLTGKSYTYGQFKEAIIKVANGLHSLGLKKNDVLMVFSGNCIDFTVLLMACSCLGVWFSAANPMYTPAELARQLEHSEAKAIFVGEDILGVAKDALDSNAKLRNQIKHTYTFGSDADGFKSFSTLLQNDSTTLPDVQINPVEDVLALPYSSGTTGFPKGVMITHYNVVANIMQCQHFMPKPGGFKQKTVLGLLPFYHIYGMSVIQFNALKQGGKLVILPRFEPTSFLQCLQDKKIQIAYVVPPLMVFLAKHPMVAGFDLSSLEKCMCGAAALGEEITNEFLNKFGRHIEMQQGYGLTETSPVCVFDNEFHPGSIGFMIAKTDGKIIDIQTKENLGPEQDGELCIKGPQVMKGYFKNEEATREMIDADGWLHTGDVAYYKDNGVLYIKDRLKELIKYKGFQVPPAELEALLLTHPDIADAGVIGIPDEFSGELPKAFVVLQEGAKATEEDIVKFVEDNVADMKRLRGGVTFIKELPKLPSGKILRKALKEM